MDNVRQAQWGPRPAAIAACFAASMVLAVAASVLATDAAGRVLAGCAAVGLLVFSAGAWRARPKLAITADGLAVAGWFRTQLLPPSALRCVRITEFRRLARKMRLLEIETTDDRLIVLSRWDLGAEPLDVLDALTAAGYAGRR